MAEKLLPVIAGETAAGDILGPIGIVGGLLGDSVIADATGRQSLNSQINDFFGNLFGLSSSDPAPAPTPPPRVPPRRLRLVELDPTFPVEISDFPEDPENFPEDVLRPSTREERKGSDSSIEELIVDFEASDEEPEFFDVYDELRRQELNFLDPRRVGRGGFSPEALAGNARVGRREKLQEAIKWWLVNGGIAYTASFPGPSDLDPNTPDNPIYPIRPLVPVHPPSEHPGWIRDLNSYPVARPAPDPCECVC